MSEPNRLSEFDAVGSMRAIRDDISRQIQDMSLEDELVWLRTEPLRDSKLERLRARLHRS
jgi:hypothetical protein